MINPITFLRRSGMGGPGRPANGASPPGAAHPLVEFSDLSKEYPIPGGSFAALQQIHLTIQPGELIVVLGKSGAGKTTLINMMTGIDRSTSGRIFVGGRPLHDLNEEQLAAWRNRHVGVVFQQFQLMPMLTCAENVMLPMDFGNRFGSQRARRTRAVELLAQMEIADQADKLPSAVSGGQQQRVAIARALANDPPLLAADEPTGNLDSGTAGAVFRLFEQQVAQGKSVVLVTHDSEMTRRADRVLRLVDGRIVD